MVKGSQNSRCPSVGCNEAMCCSGVKLGCLRTDSCSFQRTVRDRGTCYPSRIQCSTITFHVNIYHKSLAKFPAGCFGCPAEYFMRELRGIHRCRRIVDREIEVCPFADGRVPRGKNYLGSRRPSRGSITGSLVGSSFNFRVHGGALRHVVAQVLDQGGGIVGIDLRVVRHA